MSLRLPVARRRPAELLGHVPEPPHEVRSQPQVLVERRVHGGYHVVSYAVMGAILGVWH